MAINDDTESGIDGVLSEAWVITDGTVVPETDDVTLKNGGRRLDATYLYADLAQSSWLAQKVDSEIVAKVIRSYLNAASRLLSHFGGAIRSFDGDRVMAIFIGTSKNTSAVKAAFALNWATLEVIQSKLKNKWPVTLKDYEINHGIGIATGKALVVRGGVRNHNDLVSIGSAPNIAAKLSDLRGAPYIYITSGVYGGCNDSVKRNLKDTYDIWSKYADQHIGGSTVSVHSATYWRKPGA